MQADELADNFDDERKLERAARAAERRMTEDGRGQRTRAVAAPEERFVVHTTGHCGAGHHKAGSTTTAAKVLVVSAVGKWGTWDGIARKDRWLPACILCCMARVREKGGVRDNVGGTDNDLEGGIISVRHWQPLSLGIGLFLSCLVGVMLRRYKL